MGLHAQRIHCRIRKIVYKDTLYYVRVLTNHKTLFSIYFGSNFCWIKVLLFELDKCINGYVVSSCCAIIAKECLNWMREWQKLLEKMRWQQFEGISHMMNQNDQCFIHLSLAPLLWTNSHVFLQMSSASPLIWFLFCILHFIEMLGLNNWTSLVIWVSFRSLVAIACDC